ncbi:hypothetical protein [Mycobacterium heckeshornense]|uniref:hypothetical protein n=1 Tax=Mycobacterium heckeshornense TaxID=110505 RepID=UPI000662048E|nr:hypothetical protein [Mycobacterium heckeshornense]KMV22058.1 hypothetical protein ACT16_13085 [Mycobacterium heckeshornense]
MAASQRHIELEPDQANAANMTTGQVVASLSATAPETFASAPASVATGAPGWSALSAIAAETGQQSATVLAALGARGIKIDRKNFEAVAAMVETDEANANALTTRPVEA